MCTPSTTLAVWTSAWQAGACAPDDLLAALHAWAPSQFVLAGDRIGTESTDIGSTELLRLLRNAPGARLLLPVPGDSRGLPAGSSFAVAAMTAGEGVLAGSPGSIGVGLVPRHDQHDVLGWAHFTVRVPDTPPIDVGLGEAEYQMRDAVRTAADALAELRGPGYPGFDPRREVEVELDRMAYHQYPEKMSPRARRVLTTADHVAAILTVAERTPAAAPPSAAAQATHADVTRPLWDAIRTARVAAAAHAF
ncbi:hypothetical protein [Skermania piniformis]|uniref:Uncharacterized protein n=1 Tax=Skermania pinensis TaxID=39122 RepID=A0ABX8S3G7_9ACTN|nr:hypothetical protein [Skermania piniformis]QXQ12367.1 hypothetical protein KV203_10170 [Skermania piniformis]